MKRPLYVDISKVHYNVDISWENPKVSQSNIFIKKIFKFCLRIHSHLLNSTFLCYNFIVICFIFSSLFLFYYIAGWTKILPWTTLLNSIGSRTRQHCSCKLTMSIITNQPSVAWGNISITHSSSCYSIKMLMNLLISMTTFLLSNISST